DIRYRFYDARAVISRKCAQRSRILGDQAWRNLKSHALSDEELIRFVVGARLLERIIDPSTRSLLQQDSPQAHPKLRRAEAFQGRVGRSVNGFECVPAQDSRHLGGDDAPSVAI